MPSYKAPLDDMRFVLNEVLDIAQLSRIRDFETLDGATTGQFLSLGAQVAEEVLTPLNASGDHEGCRYDRDAKTVATPSGFKAAYEQFCQSGFTAISCDPQYGGMGMPLVLNTALSEMFCSANMAFCMYPGLSHGAYNALHEYGTEDLKKQYLPKLVTGEWTGTMCLTEPHCGTDLGLIKTKAVRQPDGSYAVTGTKIFISAGEHDLSSNIVHLVLARIDDPSTPPGIKGISLFLVPKFLPDAAGNPSARNPAFCGRIEEKMGIHANSTCEMNFEGAQGWLVGEMHKGMKAMFVMMNEARLGVGLQGLGLSEMAYQNAVAYALDRKQGQPVDQKADDASLSKPPVAIIRHPEVRRELLTVRAETEASRMLAYWVAMQLDISQRHADEKTRQEAKKIVDLLTPVVKAHLTDNAVDHASAAMQVFGGHGYIREHGMEQFLRDARITRTYEGTNGIQALDLMGRKIFGRENLLGPYLALLTSDVAAARAKGVPAAMTRALARAVWKLRLRTLKLQMKGALNKAKGRNGETMLQVAGAASDYLKMFSLIVLGHMWVRMAGAAAGRMAGGDPTGFYKAKLDTAQFYFDKILPRVSALDIAMSTGANAMMALPDEGFARTQGTIGEKN